MNTKQQMRWNRAAVQPFPGVRTAVSNDVLEAAFCHHYPGFRPGNTDEAAAAVTSGTLQACVLPYCLGTDRIRCAVVPMEGAP